MYSKDELSSKSMSELEEIAKSADIDVNNSKTQEDIIYAILDKQAEVEGNKNPLGTKRRRTRILKKDTDRVYSVNGKDGENFDLKKNKATIEQQSLFKDTAPQKEPADNAETPEPEEPVTVKRRVRRTKKEVEAPVESEPVTMPEPADNTDTNTPETSDAG